MMSVPTYILEHLRVHHAFDLPFLEIPRREQFRSGCTQEHKWMTLKMFRQLKLVAREQVEALSDLPAPREKRRPGFMHPKTNEGNTAELTYRIASRS